MSTHPDPVCITCGLSAGQPAQLNRLSNGQTCPTCRDRVLDSLPSALPSARFVRIGASTAHLEPEAIREPDFDAQHRPWPPHGLGG
jgi:hypothetical protein